MVILAELLMPTYYPAKILIQHFAEFPVLFIRTISAYSAILFLFILYFAEDCSTGECEI